MYWSYTIKINKKKVVKYLAISFAIFALSMCMFFLAPHAGDIGFFIGMNGDQVKLLYVVLFFFSHFMFFAPFVWLKDPYRVIAYALVCGFAVYNAAFRYMDVQADPHIYIKNQAFELQYLYKNAI